MAATLTPELAHAVAPDTAAGVARDVHELIAASVAPIAGSPFGRDRSLRSADGVAHGIDDPAAFRAGKAVIHGAAVSLIAAVAPALATAPLALAAWPRPPSGTAPGLRSLPSSLHYSFICEHIHV